MQSFSQLNLAQEFIEESGFPLVGGLQFQGTAQFVLPKILVEQDEKGVLVSFFVKDEQSANDTLAHLKTLKISPHFLLCQNKFLCIQSLELTKELGAIG